MCPRWDVPRPSCVWQRPWGRVTPLTKVALTLERYHHCRLEGFQQATQTVRARILGRAALEKCRQMDQHRRIRLLWDFQAYRDLIKHRIPYLRYRKVAARVPRLWRGKIAVNRSLIWS